QPWIENAVNGVDASLRNSRIAGSELARRQRGKTLRSDAAAVSVIVELRDLPRGMVREWHKGIPAQAETQRQPPAHAEFVLDIQPVEVPEEAVVERRNLGEGARLAQHEIRQVVAGKPAAERKVAIRQKVLVEDIVLAQAVQPEVELMPA